MDTRKAKMVQSVLKKNGRTRKNAREDSKADAVAILVIFTAAVAFCIFIFQDGLSIYSDLALDNHR